VPEDEPHDVAAMEVPITYESLADDVNPGDRILINDGLIELVVLDVEGRRVHARVVHGGKLSSHKGINLPGVQVSAPSITDKDRADVEFAVAHELDYIALSFVRRAEDVHSLRALIPKRTLIVAKIEKDQALDNIEEIVRATDAVMVARGDLGVELPFERVPLAQKQIIHLSQRLGRPVITATQMLESMIENPRPTRAEASDVGQRDPRRHGRVMLSAETAAGRVPAARRRRPMRRIITEIEAHPTPLMLRDRAPRPRGAGGHGGGDRRPRPWPPAQQLGAPPGDRVHQERLHGAHRGVAPPAGARARPHRQPRRWRGSWRWCGASCRRWCRRRRTTPPWPRWRLRHRRGAPAGGARRPRRSSRRACRSASPGRRTR
jgi:pyruvate kinase